MRAARLAPALACVLAASLLLGAGARADEVFDWIHAHEADSARDILAAQPADLVHKLHDDKLVVLQEVREGGALSGGLIIGYVLFDRPVARVYDFLSQTDRQAEFRPEITRIETVERLPDGPVDEHHLKILFRHYSYRLRYVLDPADYRIRWSLAPDYHNDLDEVSGFWELFALDADRTLGRFGARVSVGPAVPGFLQDWITRKNLPGSMERVREWVDSDGSYRP